MSTAAKWRIAYAAAFALLLGVEIFIGVFVHDRFVRPYLGDVLVVIVLYCLVRIIVPINCPWLCGAIFVFSAAVEFLQGMHIADLLGIHNPVLRTIIGTSFDPGDILCYFIGCFFLDLYELVLYLIRRSRMQSINNLQ